MLSILSVFVSSLLHSSVAPLTPLHSRQPRTALPSQVQCYASYSVWWFLVQSKTAQCNAVWWSQAHSTAIQCSEVYRCLVQSTPVQSQLLKSSLIHASTLQCISIRNYPSQYKPTATMQCSAVQSSPVPLTEVHCSVFQSGAQCRLQNIPAETREVQPRAVRCHPLE